MVQNSSKVLRSAPLFFTWWWESHKNILHVAERVKLQIRIWLDNRSPYYILGWELCLNSFTVLQFRLQMFSLTCVPDVVGLLQKSNHLIINMTKKSQHNVTICLTLFVPCNLTKLVSTKKLNCLTSGQLFDLWLINEKYIFNLSKLVHWVQGHSAQWV